MSQRNLDQPILNNDDLPMKEQLADGSTKATNIRMTVRACLGAGPMVFDQRSAGLIPDTNVSGTDKIRMFELGIAMKNPGPVELISDDITLIKRCINHLPPFMYGQICSALEKDAEQPSKK